MTYHIDWKQAGLVLAFMLAAMVVGTSLFVAGGLMG
jgi:hypothetical protein